MAEEFICTPNTRLRKDRELFGNLAGFTFSAQHPEKVKPVNFKSSSVSLEEYPKAIPKEKNFSVFHKKQGVRSLQDQQGRREARLETVSQRQKNRRSELVMDRRKVRDITPPVDLTPEVAGSSKNGNNNDKANNNKAESRKEQLERWRKQKEAAAALQNKKKPNGPATKTAPTRPNPVPVKPATSRIGAPAVRQAPGQGVGQINKVPTAPARKPITLEAKIHARGPAGDAKVGERRVTRAMVKAQTTGPSAVSMQPAIAKMKNLTIDPKTKKPVGVAPAAKPKVGAAAAPKVPSSRTAVKKAPSKEKIAAEKEEEMKDAEVHRVPASARSTENVRTAGQPAVASNNDAPMEAPPAAAKPKKKIMGIDSVYVEFNQKLAEASTVLMTNWKYWEERKKDEAIPEDILGDIESSQGQAKLLMDSKLPQFAQLLYFYLSKEENPKAVLPCDLQGWWDVAAIQVEKVTARFVALSNLAKNGWRPATPPLVKTQRATSMQKSSRAVSDPNGEATTEAKTKALKPKVQASAGLRAFLASKRKNVNSNNEDAESKTEEKTEPAPPAPTTPAKATTPVKNTSPVRQFEGGFFQIASPLRSSNKISVAPSPRVEALKSASKAPLSRRSSIGSNASLVMLRVRNSMGPMCKLGATTEQQGIESPISVDPLPYASSDLDGHSESPFLPTLHSSVTAKRCETVQDGVDEAEFQVVNIFSGKRSQQGGHLTGLGSVLTHRTESPRRQYSEASEGRHCHRKATSSAPRVKLKCKQPRNLVTLKIRSRCIFSRSFHHFMGGLKSGDTAAKKSGKNQRNNACGKPKCSDENIPATAAANHNTLKGTPFQKNRRHSSPNGCARGSPPVSADSTKSWSPFSYKQMGLFDDNQLRLELCSIFPDWTQEFTVDPSSAGIPSCWSGARNDPYVTFVRGDTSPDPVTYCEIFGAQNCFDSHPEYSPFNDDSMRVIQSLISKHQSPVEAEPCPLSEVKNLYKCPAEVNNCWRPSPEMQKSHFRETKRQNRSSKLNGIQIKPPFSRTVSPPPVIQCQVCSIFQSMQNRRSKVSAINIAMECTNCGRFTDVTPRRSMRNGPAQQQQLPGTPQPDGVASEP